jgi:diacylglycerol O-acyltransferase / wax synthase
VDAGQGAKYLARTGSNMKQLSGLDNVFLRLERGNQHMHVAGLAIYDPSSAPEGRVRFKDVLRFFESRLDVSPIFRRRLVEVPLAADRPYWVEDAAIDVEFHVRHIALPQPGDWRQLCIQVARIHSRPLDRSKPMWEAYVIEGLDNIAGLPRGSFALYVKFHHCALDGEAGTEIIKAIHALSADETGATSEGRHRMRDREPSAVELCSRAVANNLGRIPKFTRLMLESAGRAANLGRAVLPADGKPGGPRAAELAGRMRRAPLTRFSGRVSAHRVVEAVGVGLPAMRAIRAAVDGATINDVFLATVGGALNLYLGSKHELPAQSMTAMVPMTLRGANKGEDAGNQIGLAVMRLHSEIADPLDRLRAIHTDAGKAKALSEGLGKDLAKQAFDVLPTLAATALTRNMMIPQMNVVVSNVRGPDVPLYMAGARLVSFAPISIAIDGLGLNVTAFSYQDVMFLCMVACRDMLPDPGFFADCLRSSFQGLADAAQQGSKPASPARRTRRRAAGESGRAPARRAGA